MISFIYVVEVVDGMAIIYVDNNSSTICFLKETNATNDNGKIAARIPPELKIQESILNFFSSDHMTRLKHRLLNTKPFIKEEGESSKLEKMNEGEHTLFIELAPGRERQPEILAAARNIMILAPLLRRYHFSMNSSMDLNVTKEWHYLLIKSMVTVNSNSTSNNDDFASVAGASPSISAWASHLKESVQKLAEVQPEMLKTAEEIAYDDIYQWLEITRQNSCPILNIMLSPLLKMESNVSQTGQPWVRLRGNCIEINLAAYVQSIDFGKFGKACLIHLIQAAAEHPLVISVSVGSSFHFTNYDVVSMSQSGTLKRQPYRAAGLSGLNQICGVADTGLDGQ